MSQCVMGANPAGQERRIAELRKDRERLEFLIGEFGVQVTKQFDDYPNTTRKAWWHADLWFEPHTRGLRAAIDAEIARRKRAVEAEREQQRAKLERDMLEMQAACMKARK